MKESQHRVLKDCRQQLRAQLYQQRENIHFDPVLQATCTMDIKQFCFNIEPGNSQVTNNVVSNITKNDHILLSFYFLTRLFLL